MFDSRVNWMVFVAARSMDDMRWSPLPVRPAASCPSESPWHNGSCRLRFWSQRPWFYFESTFEILGSQISLMDVFAVWSRGMRWRPLPVRPAAGCSSASPWQSRPHRRRFWCLHRRFPRRRHQGLRSPNRFAQSPRERHLRRRRRQQLCRSGELADLAGRSGTVRGLADRKSR